MSGHAIDLEPFADDVYAVAARYGVSTNEVIPVPVQGQVNLTVQLGSELILRIPRAARFADRLATEAAIIPLARKAGVPTPALVDYDTSRRVARVPYAVQGRVNGLTLQARRLGPEQHTRALASLGEVLAKVHRIHLHETGQVDTIPSPFAFSPAELVDELQDAGEIGSTQGAWLLERFDLLVPGGPSLADPVLLHRDVIPSNVFVDSDGTVTSLIDWGSAEWGAPARDLVSMPLRALPGLLAGYRTAQGTSSADDGRGLEREALWFHLYLGLVRLLKRPSTSEDRNWAAPRHATLLDLLAFVAAGAPPCWQDLLPQGPDR